MHRLGRHLRILGASIAALAALTAVAASPAMAEEVSATYSGTSMKMTTSGATIKKAGAEPKACTLFGGATAGPVSGGNLATVQNEGFPVVKTVFNCTGGTVLRVLTWLVPKYDTTTGGYVLRVAANGASDTSPWGGTFTQSTADLKGTWVNGSKLTASTVTYKEALVGYASSGQPITLSGTFTATTNTGGLLTLSH